MASERRQSLVGLAEALWGLLAAVTLGGCGSGANAPGDVERVFDASSRRWVSSMTPIEIDEVRPEATLTLGARVEQVEVDTADGALLTSWVELEFVVTTELDRNREFTRVQSGKKVETEGEMQLIGQSWPHLNCRSVSLRADGAPIRLTPADLEGERAAYEGRVINRDGRAVALRETIRGRIPPAELEQILRARRSRGDLCGTKFELSSGERKDLSELLVITARSPIEPVAAPAPEADEDGAAPSAPSNTRRIRPAVRQRTVVPPKGPGDAPAVVPPTPTVGRRPVAAPAPKQGPALRAAPATPPRAVPSRAGSRPVVRGQHSRATSAPAAPAAQPAAATPGAVPGQPVAPAATPAPTAKPKVPAVAPAPAVEPVPATTEPVDPFAPATP